MKEKQRFSLDTVRELEAGRAADAFDAALKAAVLDCTERPGIARDRKLALEVFVTPVLDEKGQGADTVEIRVEVTSKTPARGCRPYKMLAHKNGQVSFHPDLPDDPSGATLFDKE